jgi:uncharacterized protein
MSNIPAVQAMYAAFGEGNIPAILGHLAEDVVWEYGLVDSGVPWLKHRRGRAEVSGFFDALAGLDFQRFQPKTFLESGDTVVSLIDVTFTVKSTGRTVDEVDEVHVWRFNRDGQVASFCHRMDTHKHWLAFRGESV